MAAVKIQKGWRGYWVRKIKMARMPGSEENAKTHEQLMKAWGVIEPQAEQNGLYLFRFVYSAIQFDCSMMSDHHLQSFVIL